MKKFSIMLTALTLICILSLPASAVTIRENLLGTQTSFRGYWGQSVVTGSGPGWDNLEFSFYSSGGPQAFGNIFLLDQQYSGAPDDLSSLTPGYIASASDAGSSYVFDSSVTIMSNTTYWFYTDDTVSGILLGNTFSGVAGEGHYFISQPNLNFNGPFNGVNFTLAGEPVPEPTTMLLLGSGIIGLAVLRRRKMKNN